MATVIKASGPLRASDGGSFNFDDVGQRANDYLETVRRQAAEIVHQAQQDAIAIRKQAEEEGRAAAMLAAERVLDEKVGRQLTTLAPALKQAIDRIEGSHAEWLQHWERTAIHVAARIASRVIRREVQRAPEITLSLVKEALELAAGCGEVQLRLHPDDHAALGGQVERLAGELSRLGSAKILADATIAKGACRIDTRFGSIDQQFEAQLARIEQELT